MTLFRATAIGETARRILETGGRASVMGVTSRGVFITNAAEQVVFVSFEGWRGPLTVNLGKLRTSPPPSPDFPTEARSAGKGLEEPTGFNLGEAQNPPLPPLRKGGKNPRILFSCPPFEGGGGGDSALGLSLPFQQRNSRALFDAKKDLASSFSQIEHGDPVILEAGHILFPQADILVAAEDVPGWKAEPRRVAGLEPPAIERLRCVARQVVAAAQGKGWTVVLERWLKPDHPPELPAVLAPIEQNLTRLRQAVRAGDTQAVLPPIAQLIGRGSGLTPSGDDVLIGLFLILNVITGKDSLLFNTQYAIRNMLSTTRLSTNLMSAAAQGQADERLITALNGILSGDLPESECAARLLTYGSSSGADSLLGMTLVVA